MGSNGADERDMASLSGARLISPRPASAGNPPVYIWPSRPSTGTVSAMQNVFFLVLRLLAAAVFFVLLGTGVWMALNHQRLFGVDPTMPGETGSSRAYRQVQIFTVWAHALVATAAFAIFLH